MEIQAISHEKFGKIRTQVVESTPWFVAKDVCDALGLKNARMAIKTLDDEERSKFNLPRQGSTWHVNESGLYQLIFQSRKPQAKQFTRWVTSEVLPSIRRTGSYRLDIPPTLHVNNHLCHSYLHWCLRHGYSVRSGQYSKRIRRHPEHFIKHNQLWYISQDYGQALLAYRRSVRHMESATPISQLLLFKTETN